MEEGAGPLKTDDKPDYSQTISWKNLSSEIRQSVFTWGNFFTVLTIGLLPSLFDFGTDYLQAVNFLWGSNYTKQVANHAWYTHFGNCSHIGRYTSFTGLTPEIVYDDVSCFEVDEIWGYATLGIILLPGFRVAVWSYLEARNTEFSMLTSLGILGIFTICAPLFPLLVLVLKVVAMTRPGPEIKKLSDKVVIIEGVWESTLQLLLNLFIIFTRADRSPSTIQLASTFTSLLLIVKTAIADFSVKFSHRKLPTKATLDDQVRHTLPLLPMFLFNTIFKLGSIGIVASLLRYWTLAVFHGIPLIVSSAILVCTDKDHLRCGWVHHALGLVAICRRTSWFKQRSERLTEKQSIENLVFHNILWLSVNTATLFCIGMTANFNYLDHMTDNTIFLKDIKQLNFAIAGVLTSGIASAVLIFIQLWRPFQRENCKSKEPKDLQNQKENEPMLVT